MPSSSQKQHNFMEAIAHNPKFAKQAGVPVSVGQDFAAADKKSKKFADGGVVGPLTQNRNLLTQTVVQPSDIDKSDLRTALPRVYGALAGLAGTPPDQIEGSVMEPGYDARRQGADMTFPIGTALQMLPGLKGLATAMAAEKMIPSGSLAAQRGAITWHGSPHTFDAFDASKIGTGEGAQAYGHGLYLADSPGVGKSYLTAGIDRNEPMFISSARSAATDPTWGSTAAEKEAAIRRIAGDKAGDYLRDNFDRLQSQAGNLYGVDLPDTHIAKMLDWDVPLSEHPQSVQDAIANMSPIKNLSGQEIAGKGSPSHFDPTGSDIYGMLQARNGPSEAASMLRQSGIPGIKYLDGGSRSAGTGTSNYVVFPGEEKNLTILERNGIPTGNTPAIPDPNVPAPPPGFAKGGSVQDPISARLHHILYSKPLDQIDSADHDFINSLIQKGRK